MLIGLMLELSKDPHAQCLHTTYPQVCFIFEFPAKIKVSCQNCVSLYFPKKYVYALSESSLEIKILLYETFVKTIVENKDRIIRFNF